MSVFDRLDRMTSRAVDRVYANGFTCQPMLASANGRPSPDPERGTWEGTGVLDEAPEFHSIEIGNRERSGNAFHSIANGHSFALSVDRLRYPAADATRQGDRVAIADRTFEVSSVQPDGMSRVLLVLSLASA